jgi:hypothetical protein
VSEFDASGTATNFEGRNCRNMEPGQHQYSCSWYDIIYIYASRGQLCKSGYFKNYHRRQHPAHLSNHSQFILSECHGASAPGDIERRNYRNMESGEHQHFCPRNRDLYIYAIRGQLCDSGFIKHYHCCHRLTDFSNNSKFILSECHGAGASFNIE